MPELVGESIACIRGERQVFDGLTFRLTSGEALVLVGRNGAGKSSLLRILAGLLPPAAGRLCWNGKDIRPDLDSHRARVRFVGHADAVKPALSALENLHTWAVLWGGRHGAEARAREALSRFAIDRLAELPGRWLSAGQRRRLALARLLLAPAPLWLLDEPRTALDVDAAALLDAAVERHRTEGGMVVMALHEGARPPGARTLDVGAARLEAC